MKKVLMLLVVGLALAAAVPTAFATGPQIKVQDSQAAATASVSWWSYLLNLL